MKELFDYLLKSPITNNVVTIAFFVIIISITLIYVIAFFQGRNLSFWPPSIGNLPNNSTGQSSSLSGSGNSITRRGFIPTVTGTFVGLTAGWLIGQKQTSDQQKTSGQQPSVIQWTMDTFLSESAKNTILYDAPQAVCDRVREMSGGRFIITLKRSGKTEQLLNDVNEGVVQCGYNGIYYGTKKLKILYFGCAIPFGLNPQEQNAWLYYKKDPSPEAPTFMQSIYSMLDYNVIAFPAGATGGQAGGWFREPVNSIKDFQKKTMRIPGFGAEVVQKFGARTHEQLAKLISIDESIKRLKDGGDGGFDAVEWTGPHDDLILGLDKAAKFYYFPGWWEPSTTYEVQVNKDAWNNLPLDEYREIFKAACSEVHMSTLAQYISLNSKALKELKEKIPETGIKLVQFNEEILKAARDETINLLDQYAKDDEDFKYVYDEWKNFTQQIRGWSKQNEIPSKFFLDF